MLLSSQLQHVGVGYVGDGVRPVGAGAGGVVHEVFCAADLVCVTAVIVDSLK